MKNLYQIALVGMFAASAFLPSPIIGKEDSYHVYYKFNSKVFDKEIPLNLQKDERVVAMSRHGNSIWTFIDGPDVDSEADFILKDTYFFATPISEVTFSRTKVEIENEQKSSMENLYRLIQMTGPINPLELA